MVVIWYYCGMTFEGLDQNSNIQEKQLEKINDKELFRARNEMQIKLAARFYGFEIENEQLEKWIDVHSKKFCKIINEHPEFIDEYVHGETEKAVDELAELLYEKHEVHS